MAEISEMRQQLRDGLAVVDKLIRELFAASLDRRGLASYARATRELPPITQFQQLRAYDTYIRHEGRTHGGRMHWRREHMDYGKKGFNKIAVEGYYPILGMTLALQELEDVIVCQLGTGYCPARGSNYKFATEEFARSVADFLREVGPLSVENV